MIYTLLPSFACSHSPSLSKKSNQLTIFPPILHRSFPLLSFGKPHGCPSCNWLANFCWLPWSCRWSSWVPLNLNEQECSSCRFASNELPCHWALLVRLRDLGLRSIFRTKLSNSLWSLSRGSIPWRGYRWLEIDGVHFTSMMICDESILHFKWLFLLIRLLFLRWMR